MRTTAFSLVEILVALTILSVGIIGILGVFSLGVRAAGKSDRYKKAIELAENKLELAASPASWAVRDETQSQDGLEWTMVTQDAPKGLKLTSIQVEWTERGKSQAICLSRLYLPANSQE